MSTLQYLAPVIMIVAFAYTMYFRRKQQALFDEKYAHYKLSDLAQLLGLRVTSGDPSMNMMNVHSVHIQQKAQQVPGKGLGQLLNSETTKATEGSAEGERWGRRYRFAYEHRTDVQVQTHLLTNTKESTTTEYFGMSLSAELQQPSQEFEVHVTTWPQYCEPRIQTSLPRQSSGVPAIDGVLTIKCADPRLAQALAPALAPLMTNQGLHLVCDGRSVRAISTRFTYPMLLTHLEDTQRGLEQIACILEGREYGHAAMAASAAPA